MRLRGWPGEADKNPVGINTQLLAKRAGRGAGDKRVGIDGIGNNTGSLDAECTKPMQALSGNAVAGRLITLDKGGNDMLVALDDLVDKGIVKGEVVSPMIDNDGTYALLAGEFESDERMGVESCVDHDAIEGDCLYGTKQLLIC